MIPNQPTQGNTTAWLDRLEQIQKTVQNRFGEGPNVCQANASIDDLIDLVRALAERVAVLEAGR